MIDFIIRLSLKNRLLVVLAAVALCLYGAWVGSQLSIDVFPDLNRPRVTILTESHGLAPEEVETLVTIPIESVLNGTPNVVGIRSSSGVGISIIYVDFEWGTDIYRNRQLIAERLQLAQSNLPADIQPVMGPISSIMGEIQFVGLVNNNKDITPLEVRTIADWVLRPRLMSISGVSQVVVMGGGVKQYQILLSTEKLQNKGISIEEFQDALEHLSLNTTGGFLNKDDKEFLIRPLGRASSIEDIQDTAIGVHLGKPVLLKDVAEVQIGAKEKRGEASINAVPSVVLTIQKQPQADTVSLTKKIDAAIADLQPSLPEGLIIETNLFKQSHFIETSIANVIEALRDGTIIVAIILFLFLLNLRTTFITLTAIPMSFVITFLLFKWFGLSINTMTLGGLAVAIGELVDDAIVDVENVFRRLRENYKKASPVHPVKVVYRASKEIRSSIVISTLIVVAVFIPLFALSGLEGRLFTPMGAAYIISLLASLFISLTLTPVLCYFLLPNSKIIKHKEEPIIVDKLKKWCLPLFELSIKYWKSIVVISLVPLVISLFLLSKMESNFLPEFNEGTATIGVAAYPGISLPKSNELGIKVEKAIMSVPEVKSTVRRTGRAEMDEHAEGVHWSEIDVDFNHPLNRPIKEILNDIRSKILEVGDLGVNLGQPISHRIDHMMSGVRAQIALKIFGSDAVELRRIAVQIESILTDIDGLVDIQIEPLVKVPQLAIQIDRYMASEYGLSPGQISQDLEIGLRGEPVGKFIENQKIFDIFARLDNSSRTKTENINDIILKTMPSGQKIKVSDVADVYPTDGPNMINRENMQRRLIVSANSPERALTDVASEIQRKIDQLDVPEGYYVEMGGQFKSQVEANNKILFLGLIAIVTIMIILFLQFRSVLLSLLVLSNIPLALIGSVFAIWITDLDLSLATTVAFITLCGIASRNGVLVINHYMDLLRSHENSELKKLVIQGSLDRLIPVLMTAGTAILALTPLALSRGEPGKEILFPVAVVIIGGLITSTILNTFLVPALFYKLGSDFLEKIINKTKNNQTNIEE
ncbi:MAG: efflux RND transporter permease subunit [Bdellovibrionales bacterium]|nr:efflux RND transporter permease subunit [Bdellovibrionales bacterium]